MTDYTLSAIHVTSSGPMCNQRDLTNQMTTDYRLRTARKAIREEYCRPDRTPWIIGFSGGKDSTLLAHLVVECVLSVPPDERGRPVHLVSNDTLVESPIFQTYVDNILGTMAEGLKALSLPVRIVKTRPQAADSFWVNLLGRGYPAPNRSFRWCTDRMKIRPTSQFIKDCVSRDGRAILLLGVRRSESAERAKNIARRDELGNGERLKPHDDLKGCLVFCPIQELTTDDVWVTLLESHPPWGGRYADLFNLYHEASDGDCPFVMGDNDAASCGSTSARFGCWTCTVVEKDRSLVALVGNGNVHLQPLVEFRERIKAVSEDPAYRSKTRRNGQPGLGPITPDGRALLLNGLLETQAAANMVLISEHEIRLIKEQWARDAVTQTFREMDKPAETIGRELHARLAPV